MDQIEESDNFINENFNKENDIAINNTKESKEILVKQTKSEKFSSIMNLFAKKLLLFTSLRSLINLLKLLIKIKLNLKKISIVKLLEVIFDWGNLKSGMFLSSMPLIYSLLTEVIFDLDEEKNKTK